MQLRKIIDKRLLNFNTNMIMGMYDNIDFEMGCPVCGAVLNSFQSKDGPCLMDTLDVDDVDQFYDLCHTCKTFITFNRKVSKQHTTKFIKDVKKDFDMEIKYNMESNHQ